MCEWFEAPLCSKSIPLYARIHCDFKVCEVVLLGSQVLDAKAISQ